MTLHRRRFAFAEPLLILVMFVLIGMLAYPRTEPLRIRARSVQTLEDNLDAEGRVGDRAKKVTPAEADLPAGVHLGTYGMSQLDEVP